MNRFKEYLQRKYALSAHGASDVCKGIGWTVATNLVMFGGIGILYFVMAGFMDTLVDGAALPPLLMWTLVVVAFGVVSFGLHYMQYHYTYSVVYEEVGTVRTTLAERLRKLPLSFFAHRDLAELTETMMSDVDSMEHVWSHVLGYLYGAYVSTAVEFVALMWFDWRLAVACLWGVPVAFALLWWSHGVTRKHNLRFKKERLAMSDGIQELLEDAREIRATNQEGAYLAGLADKIDRFEQAAIRSELATGLFVNACSVIMRLGVATTVLVGARLVLAGEVGFMVYFMYLLAITRVYAPFDQALALIAEVFVTETSVARMNEIMDAPVAEGTEDFAPANYDIAFDHVGFSYGEGTGAP
ncbi:MAG: ABC transporter ATP-binding protein, partial [Coriobacteriales bacterium]|nr:ABC transporter ATP-binding protein [Coriobacteriales bacterium]